MAGSARNTMVALVEISCAICGLKKSVRPIDIARGKGKYCSALCSQASKRRPRNRCENCGEEVKKNSRRFCSIACRDVVLTVDVETRFWVYVIKTDGCWAWGGAIGEHGYGVISYPGGTVTAHRLSFKIANGYLTDELSVLHRCHNKPCVRPDHLYEGTHNNNMRDMAEAERGSTTKLSWEDRIMIVDMASVGMSSRQISEFFPVTPQAIRHWTRQFETRPMRHGGKRA